VYLKHHSGPIIAACRTFDAEQSSSSIAQSSLLESISQAQIEVSGPSMRLFYNNASTQLCLPVDTNLNTTNGSITLNSLPETDILSIFSLSAFDENAHTLLKSLLTEAKKRGLDQTGPARLYQYDNDGMGLTGELVIELQLPVTRKGNL